MNPDKNSSSLRIWFGAILFIIVLFIFSIVKLVKPYYHARALHSLYLKTKPGMNLNEITNSMGVPDKITYEAAPVQWDFADVEGVDPSVKRKVLFYSVDTVFLPTSFTFQFDDNGKLIGRHRYD